LSIPHRIGSTGGTGGGTLFVAMALHRVHSPVRGTKASAQCTGADEVLEEITWQLRKNSFQQTRPPIPVQDPLHGFGVEKNDLRSGPGCKVIWPSRTRWGWPGRVVGNRGPGEEYSRQTGPFTVVARRKNRRGPCCGVGGRTRAFRDRAGNRWRTFIARAHSWVFGLAAAEFAPQTQAQISWTKPIGEFLVGNGADSGRGRAWPRHFNVAKWRRRELVLIAGDWAAPTARNTRGVPFSVFVRSNEGRISERLSAGSNESRQSSFHH